MTSRVHRGLICIVTFATEYQSSLSGGRRYSAVEKHLNSNHYRKIAVHRSTLSSKIHTRRTVQTESKTEPETEDGDIYCLRVSGYLWRVIFDSTAPVIRRVYCLCLRGIFSPGICAGVPGDSVTCRKSRNPTVLFGL